MTLFLSPISPFFAVGNTEIDSVIYQWSQVTSQYVLHQSIPTQGAQSVTVYVLSDDTPHMAIANANGQSAIYTWNTFNSRFDLLVNSDPAYDLVAVGVEGQVEPLLAMANYGGGFAVEMSSIYHMASVNEDSDYVPWYVHVHFLFSFCFL